MRLALISTLALGILAAGYALWPQPQFGGPTRFNTVEEIQAALQLYYQKNGDYIQILASSTLPEDGGGLTVRQKFGKDIPDNVIVHVYEHPQGKGYQVVWDDALNIYSVGVGPEADIRTYTWSKSTPK
jgi:hypothetical protein